MRFVHIPRRTWIYRDLRSKLLNLLVWCNVPHFFVEYLRASRNWRTIAWSVRAKCEGYEEACGNQSSVILASYGVTSADTLYNTTRINTWICMRVRMMCVWAVRHVVRRVSRQNGFRSPSLLWREPLLVIRQRWKSSVMTRMYTHSIYNRTVYKSRRILLGGRERVLASLHVLLSIERANKSIDRSTGQAGKPGSRFFVARNTSSLTSRWQQKVMNWYSEQSFSEIILSHKK